MLRSAPIVLRWRLLFWLIVNITEKIRPTSKWELGAKKIELKWCIESVQCIVSTHIKRRVHSRFSGRFELMTSGKVLRDSVSHSIRTESTQLFILSKVVRMGTTYEWGWVGSNFLQQLPTTQNDPKSYWCTRFRWLRHHALDLPVKCCQTPYKSYRISG